MLLLYLPAWIDRGENPGKKTVGNEGTKKTIMSEPRVRTGDL